MSGTQSPVKKSYAGFWVLLFVAGFALWGWSRIYSDDSAGTLPTTRPAAPAWQPPAGFALAPGDAAVAVRWMDASEVKCTYSRGTCWGMEVIARDGCPNNLYVELSIQDASGTAIGYTNDTVGAVRPGQRAKLVFDTFKDDAAKALLTEVSCY